MGATNFYVIESGKSAREAFIDARSEACYMEGHGGYTGTIAEKSSFKLSRKPEGFNPQEWESLVADFDVEDKTQDYYYELKRDSKIYEDKWGPALCIPAGNNNYIFCGYASC